MDPSSFPHDIQGASEYHQPSGGFGDERDLDSLSDSGRPMSDLSLMPPPPPHGHDDNFMTPPSGLTNDKDADEKQDETLDMEVAEGAPWSEDWMAVAEETLQKSLDAYKVHVKSLFGAIDTFVKESNAIHAEWTQLQQDEYTESQRLDAVEPDIRQATRGAEQAFGGNFLAGRDDASVSP